MTSTVDTVRSSTALVADNKDSALINDLVARAGRQSTFLWHVSGDAYTDDAFLSGAVSRYDKFLRLVGASAALGRGALAPPFDVDLVWHTHMLGAAGVAAYAADTALRCGGESLDHDDNVGEGLDELWSTTQQLWDDDDDNDADSDANGTHHNADSLVLNKAVRPGAGWRGDPPPWWFDAAAPIVVVEDDFLSPEEIHAIVQQMPTPQDAVVGGGGAARGRGFGKDARCTVEVDRAIEFRILSHVANALGMPPPAAAEETTTTTTTAPPPTPSHLPAAGDVNDTQLRLDTGAEMNSVQEASSARLPARVAVGDMHAHRDRVAVAAHDGPMLGPYVNPPQFVNKNTSVIIHAHLRLHTTLARL
jgi:hypothetical protein